MIQLEDETMNPSELLKPSDDVPMRLSLWLHNETARCEKAAKEYAATMKRPKYLPLYEMTCAKVDEENHKLFDRRKVDVELTDDEYVWLLTRSLLFGTTYLFSHLRNENPTLAQKVFAQAMDAYPDELKEDGVRYQVFFNEIYENAKEIIQLQNYFFPDKVNTTTIFI